MTVHLKTISLSFLIVWSFCLNAQTTIDINTQITAASFDRPSPNYPEKRRLLVFNKKSSYYNPLAYLAAGLLYVYQNIFSEQIQANCVYQTSCSEFTKLSIQQKGFFGGVLNGFNQWSECVDGALYEHPPVFRNQENKIINYID